MSEPNAEYERGWQDAIASLNPTGIIERARLNVAVTGLQRRFAEMVQHLADDQERVARALEALDAPHERAVGICGESMPSVVDGEPLPVVCELPHGHAGWHGAPPGASGPRWTAEPDVREVGRCFEPLTLDRVCLRAKGHTGDCAPEYATGGPVVMTKPLIVDEHGPELQDLAPGTTIHPQPEATDG